MASARGQYRASDAHARSGSGGVQSPTVTPTPCRPLSVLALPRFLALPLVVMVTACTNNTVGTTADETSTTAEATTTGASTTTEASTSSGPADGTSSGAQESSGTTAPVDDTSTGTPTTSGGSTGGISVCGNNVIEGDEVCDLAQVNGETCTSLGYQGGQLGCLLTCTDYNLLGCFICGNEVVDIAEDCETTVPEDLDCEALGYEAGEVTCGADCLFDTSECSICGDGVQQGPENCDGIDYGGETCASIGFDMGDLGCNLATCQFVYTGCSGGQYFQDFEGGPPLPPEFTTGGSLDWSVTNMNVINGTYSATSNDLGEGQNNFMHLDASFAIAGTISFWHDEDSEGSFDYLEFWMDGVMQQEWSGQNVAAMYMQAVPVGMHTFEWRYTKDGIVSVGLDRVWVDDITLTGGVPI
jgi:hypothetical protein